MALYLGKYRFWFSRYKASGRTRSYFVSILSRSNKHFHVKCAIRELGEYSGDNCKTSGKDGILLLILRVCKLKVPA